METLKYTLASAILLMANQNHAYADSTPPYTIPYPNVGTINQSAHTFTAANNGTIDAYFAGSNASYNQLLGLEINGVNTGQWGFENKQTAIGTEMNWNVKAGDKLTFVDYVWGWQEPLLYTSNGTPTGGLYQLSSDALKNADGNQHVYATPFDTATFGPSAAHLISELAIPAGGTRPMYMAFEDETSAHGHSGYVPGNTSSDYNYDDLNFVVTNVHIASAPEIDANPSALSLGLLTSIMLIALERHRPIRANSGLTITAI